MNLDGLVFYKKYGLNAGILLSRLDRLRRSNFTAVREQIIAEWGPGGRGLLRLGDQVRFSRSSDCLFQAISDGRKLGAPPA